VEHFMLMTLPKDVADDSSVTPAIRIWAGSCPMHDSEAGAWTISDSCPRHDSEAGAWTIDE